ncbi:MAG: hypothetical protein ACI4V1_04030 [Eubacteriales bacterium]
MKKTAANRTTEEKEVQKVKLTRIIYLFVMLSFIVPVGYLIFKIILTEPGEAAGGQGRADYVLMLLQCALGIFVMHIPTFLSRKFRFVVPPFLFVMYIVFLYCAIFLGEVRSFYYTVPHWDDILHCMSSMMTGLFGLMTITILNRDEHVVVRLSPFFMALFAFSFSVMVGALWEIYEFTFDGLLGLNMQKFITAAGETLVGHAALADTMKDIIVDTIGAFLSSTIGYFSVKFDKRWFMPELVEETKK